MNNELLSIVSYLERDRGVNREVIVHAIESAIQQAARRSLDVTNDLRVEIDRRSLAIKAFDKVVVTEDGKTGLGMLPLRLARKKNPKAQLGDVLEVEIPPTRLAVPEKYSSMTSREIPIASKILLP